MHYKLQKILHGTVNKIAGITFRLISKDTFVCQLVIVEKRKRVITILTESSGITTFEKLKENIPDNCPAMLTLEGWGVLVKEAKFDSKGRLINRVVADKEQFNIFPYQQEEDGFVGIVRSSQVQDVLLKFKQAKIDLLEATAGPFAIASLISVLKLQGEHYIGNWLTVVDNDKIQTIKAATTKSEIMYALDDEKISAEALPGFAHAVQFFSGQYSVQYENDLLNSNLLTEFAYKKLTVITGGAVLILLFIGLLVNFLLFDNYNKEYNVVTNEYHRHENVLEQLNMAEQSLKQKENLVHQGGVSQSTNFAWNTDRLACTMPDKLILTKLSVQPRSNKLQKNKEIRFVKNTIYIEGETFETQAVHQWIKLIRSEKWVNEVEMTYYGQKEDGKIATFNLELTF